MRALLSVILLIAPALAAERPAEKPKRIRRPVRVVVVKPDLKWEGANLAGGIIGNLIGQWMMRPRGPSAFDNWDTGLTPNARTDFVAPYREPAPDPIATVIIESSQPDSEVLIDAKPRGFAPISFNLPSGVRYVVVRRAGFRDWTQDVETKPGDVVTVRAELKPIPEDTFVIVVKPPAPRQSGEGR